ncbi:TadE/TadG family type IV pilus assembly protein [Kribbella sp. CA-293567]|uniref:TadE/TadG family type IV pilus assembly protein n=1 Tax=Kribbella sp. CA-293567 TaxID=3002436 RepID=UPI0022DDF694|nr:TadE/TadG family type IV pilus assembly protein [Kribbella sp. CA-293567]WBQ01815.1 pilus assembly protein [Kribbella sp. CA-293567]
MTTLGTRRGERGTMALEMVILAPLLLVLFMFLLACGRYFQTSSLLENAARDGARSASQSRSLGDAQGQVDAAVTRTMAQAVKSCQDSAGGTITTGFAAGTALSVEVTCTINYHDLGLLGIGGNTTITKRFSSSVDPYRGVRDGSQP